MENPADDVVLYKMPRKAVLYVITQVPTNIVYALSHLYLGYTGKAADDVLRFYEFLSFYFRLFQLFLIVVFDVRLNSY